MVFILHLVCWFLIPFLTRQQHIRLVALFYMIMLVKSLPPDKVPFLGTMDWDVDMIFQVTVGH